MKFTRQLKEVYAGDNITIGEKALSLAILNLVLNVGFLALGFVRLIGGHLAMGF